jgi:TonB family protein
MRTKIFSTLLLSFFCFLLHAQNEYPYFPKDQHSYLGGHTEFYKDFHQILIEKNLTPCENKKEFLSAPILIKTDGSAEILEGKFSQEKKCTFDLTKEVLKYLDKWIPAKIDGIETPAVAVFAIFPDDLFENYKEGYNFFNSDYENTDFDIQDFRKQIVKQIDLDSFSFKGHGKLTIITKFIINAEGKIDHLKIEKSSGSQRFDEMVMDAIKRTQKNKQWKPAKTHGILINSNFSFPISISIR